MEKVNKHFTVNWTWKVVLIMIAMFAIYGLAIVLKQSFNQPAIQVIKDSTYTKFESNPVK